MAGQRGHPVCCVPSSVWDPATTESCPPSSASWGDRRHTASPGKWAGTGGQEPRGSSFSSRGTAGALVDEPQSGIRALGFAAATESSGGSGQREAHTHLQGLTAPSDTSGRTWVSPHVRAPPHPHVLPEFSMVIMGPVWGNFWASA